MIIKMIMCKQVGMQENEHIKDLSNKYSLQEEDLLCKPGACPCIMNDTLTSHFNHYNHSKSARF